ncbi:MAG TPA: HAMP domain-containing sensor histidine kinase [Chitinophagales bacterium]|nr:HAMP domain-containing sensor histidine kinase [Chitinophagales bacterium]
MKLLTKINRRFLLTSIMLLTLCSVLLFFMMKYVIHADVDENLADEKEQIMRTFDKSGELPVAHNLKSDRLEVNKVSTAYEMSSSMSDTMVYNSLEEEYIPHRQLSFIISNGREKYLVKISQSELESDDLLLSLLIFTLIFISALLAVMYFFNRRISKSIWQPFNDTLEKLKTFDLTGQNKVSFSHSGIYEFEELNRSLNNMTEKIYGDYSRLKQFTENASHEIQTPLSIIRSKIEMMIQSEHLNEEQMNSIQKINEAVSRLSRLNAALLTLTKIENHQFTDAEKILLASFIRNKLKMLEEIIEQKKITVSLEADENVYVKMNSSLAELLFDNLISNAIKHNIENGFIKISIQRNQVSISNTGEPIQIASEKLFDRFVKNDPSSDSLGLGLAIVSEICKTSNFTIHFTSEENLHTIKISF